LATFLPYRLLPYRQAMAWKKTGSGI